jgi:hypothetical protein
MRSPAHLTQDAYLKKKFHLDTAWTINIYAQRVAHLDRRKDKESRVVDSFKIKRESFHLFFLFGICDVIGPRPQPGNLRQSIKTTSRLLFFFWYEIHLHLYKRWASQEQSLSPFPPPFLSSIIGFEAERAEAQRMVGCCQGTAPPTPSTSHTRLFLPPGTQERKRLSTVTAYYPALHQAVVTARI